LKLDAKGACKETRALAVAKLALVELLEDKHKAA
jgi:hypothetical protein